MSPACPPGSGQPKASPLPGSCKVPNYVQHVLKTQPPKPPIQLNNFVNEMNWITWPMLLLSPVIGIVYAPYTPLRLETAIWAIAYYFITGLGITAGYHRLWSHRAFNASPPLEFCLALMGAGGGQGSILWWSRKHRAHHRYTDTELDPYGAQKGFIWSHMLWLLVKPRHRNGFADVSDLKKNKIVMWQDRNYAWLAMFMVFVFPALVGKICWGDGKGSFIYAAIVRQVFVHHSTFCVNSLAHWLGEASFDEKHTPRDHMITALVTLGEGYHNFHHQFPMDYRNAILWYQYDPTKWTIWCCQKLGLASHLKTFSPNEIKKGRLRMTMLKLKAEQDDLEWPEETAQLPVISWDEFEEKAKKTALIVVAGFIHDVTDFMAVHPGGAPILQQYIGKEATTAFFGGVHGHSDAAHNLLAMKRVGVLHGGYQLANPMALPGAEQTLSPTVEQTVPPSQRIWIAEYTELKNAGAQLARMNGALGDDGWESASTSTAWSEDELADMGNGYKMA